MTPDEFREARQALGLSAAQMATALGYSRKFTVYEIESGRKGLTETCARLMQAYLDGYRPRDWPQK